MAGPQKHIHSGQGGILRPVYHDKICEIRRGCYFLETESTSFTKSFDLVASGEAGRLEVDIRGSELGIAKLLSPSLSRTDLFGAGSSSNLTTMPIGIPRMRWDNGYIILHALGLGSNSTSLNTLVCARQIPSHVWSILWRQNGHGAGSLPYSRVLRYKALRMILSSPIISLLQGDKHDTNGG